MTKLLVSLLAATLAFAGLAHAQQATQPLDRIVAVVDEDVILQSELDRALKNVMSQYANRQDQLPPRDILQRQVLERLILVKLQAADATDNFGIRVSDEEVDNAVNNIAAQNKLTPDQLRQQLARDNMSFDDFRGSLRDEILTQRSRQRFAQRIAISEAEVDAALAAQTKGGTQYHLAHILIALPEGATPEQIATGQQKVDGVKALLDKGDMTFAAAAVRYSDSPNALENGDLGWRSLDEIPNAFAGTITSMKAGQVIGPLRGPSGFQLVQLVETREADQAADAASKSVTQFHARHILVRDADDAKAKIETLRARIAGGADFAKVAQDDSDDAASKAGGGDLGWFTQDQFGPEFGSQVSGLQDGQVSQPFKTQAGWHIVQREGSRQTAVTDDNRRAKVRESIGQRKLEDEWNRHLHELRGEAFVDIRNGAGADATGTTAPSPAPAPAPAGKTGG